jgi:NAD(P)H-dependent flavin oxidoreductase YrpB (nitropropane dioxygenase family)
MQSFLNSDVGPKEAAMFATRLTRDYGLEFLFDSAGMGFIGLPELVAAVSNAGGLGLLADATAFWR